MPIRVLPPKPQSWPERVAAVVAKAIALPFQLVALFFIAAILSLIVGAVTHSDLALSITFLAVFGLPFYGPLNSVWRAARSLLTAREEPETEEEPIPKDPEAVELGLEIGADGVRPLHFPSNLRGRHCYVIGKTRTGKTTLLKRLVIQDMEMGHGVGFIDPHGDAAEDLLGSIPEWRLEDVVYFDPTRPDAPAFNLLRLPYPPAKLTEDVVSAFKMFFPDSWGPRLEHLLRYGVLTLLADSEPHTIRDLRSLFVNPGYRREVIARLSLEPLREFWEVEFASTPAGAINPLVNKLSALLVPTSSLERVFSNPDNALDFPSILNDGKIFIANLSKGTLGDEPSRFLGGLITTAIQQASLARAELAESERRPFFFTVDEFHNYTVSSFETILAESAKYRLHLTLANQALSQLPQSLERAIFGNVATIIAFQVSANDAPGLRREMHRSRMMVRPRQTNSFLPLRDFVAAQRGIYRDALTDQWAGMPPEERARLEGQRTVATATFFGGIFTEWQIQSEIRSRRAEIGRVLATLRAASLDAKLLRELFPDYEFRELGFPEVDDFLNLEPHHAFCRMVRADNVVAFRGLFPSPPSAEIRARVLDLGRTEAVASRSATATSFTRVAPAKPKPPVTDEDFSF